MLCPKRKVIYVIPAASEWQGQYVWGEEQFCQCLEKECAAWRMKKAMKPYEDNVGTTVFVNRDWVLVGYCGLAGEPGEKEK